MKKKLAILATPLVLSALVAMPTGAFAAQTTTNSVNPNTANATDLGPSDASQTITLSIVLKAQNVQDLQNYINETVTPGSPHYHQYLSVNQFRSHYAPTDGQINKVINYLAGYGITASSYADNLVLHATGTVDAFEQAFNFTLEDYTKNGKSYHAPKSAANIPVLLTDTVLNISGLNTYPAFNSMTQTVNSSTSNPEAETNTASAPTAGASNKPGYLTVQDAASRYDVTPLYQAGITGKGQTIGIATLANFVPQDAYNYWDAVGVKYQPGRITQVHVDGGGDLGSDAGSGETTLDVEQSGGLAPDANIMVYDAPNTDAGFLDVFYQAISDNKVNTLSVSWGSPEAFYMADGVTNELQAFDQAFMEAAAQGISTFAAAGDSGAYDTNRELPYPYFSKVVGADVPASDPYITAAGGTTLPATLHMRHGYVSTGDTERAWGWDYFDSYLDAWYGTGAEYALGYFSVGGGGAVSSIWGVPDYQQGVQGLNITPAGQSLIDYTGATPVDYADLASNFAGRNEPDLSMNADPETGYLVYSSTDGGWIREGGTSFVAPQLNGLTALMNQYVGSSVGFLNPTIYSLQKSGNAYGSNAPFNDITTGDNWYYNAVPGYDTATGIGTPNVANLATVIKNQGK